MVDHGSPDASQPGTAAAQAATHVVHAGESLWSIAKMHRVSIHQLRRFNDLEQAAVVRPGQMLKLLP